MSSNEIKWAIGLIEADGYIGFNHNGNKKWIVTLKVSLNSYNARAVYKLKNIFGLGKIHWSKEMVTWKITRRDTIKNKIIPILEEFEFRGSKYYEFILLKKAINVMESFKSKDEKHEILTRLKILSKTNTYRVSPVLIPKIKENNEMIKKYNNEKDVVLIDLISEETLLKAMDPWWLAGFIEGEGSFQINNRNQVVFELGQKYNTLIVWVIHKHLNLKSKIKERVNGEYTMLSTKDNKSIQKLITILKGKLLGIKSFEFSVWSRAYRTKKKEKKEKAKILLSKIRARRYIPF